MKRIITLLLAAGLVLGAAGASKAADIKAKGMWDFAFTWANNFNDSKGGDDYFDARQRLRTQIDVIASESLRGVVFLEMGDQVWGQASSGGSIGTDGTVVEVRFSYIDWVIPNTELKVRMGLQPVALPGFVAGSNILNHDAAGITVSAPITDNIGVNLFWARLENDNGMGQHRGADSKYRTDAFDAVGLTIPLTFDGVKVTPWGLYAAVGTDSLRSNGSANHAAPANGDQIGNLRKGLLPKGVNAATAFSDDNNGNAWWAGVTGDITLWNPFHLAVDLNYGGIDLGTDTVSNIDLKRTGWLAAVLAEYKLDMFTPGVIFWYASGDDDDPYDGSERIPSIRGSWTATGMSYDGYFSLGNGDDLFGIYTAGMMGAVIRLKDISFVEDLTHVLRVAYLNGTNDKAMANEGIITSGDLTSGYLTTKDKAWEVNFDTTYKIYDNLLLNVELGYMYLDYDKGVWGDLEETAGISSSAFRAAVNMRYAF